MTAEDLAKSVETLRQQVAALSAQNEQILAALERVSRESASVTVTEIPASAQASSPAPAEEEAGLQIHGFAGSPGPFIPVTSATALPVKIGIFMLSPPPVLFQSMRQKSVICAVFHGQHGPFASPQPEAEAAKTSHRRPIETIQKYLS